MSPRELKRTATITIRLEPGEKKLWQRFAADDNETLTGWLTLLVKQAQARRRLRVRTSHRRNESA